MSDGVWVKVHPEDAGGGLGAAVIDEDASNGADFTTLNDPDGDGKNYRLASFTSTSGGSLVVSESGIAQVLLIGGGGGAGWTQTGAGAAGGGGAGGFVETSVLIPEGTYTVTVGEKGSNGGGGSRAYAGGSSSVGDLISAAGGGAGSGGQSGAGSSGASGGGGDNRDRDTFVVGQGHAGGPGQYINGPCGGGAGGPGYSGKDPGEDGGDWTRGGPGRSSSLTGSSVTYARGGTGGNVTGGPGVWPDPVEYGDGNNGNYGGGAFPSKQGGDGVVYVRVEI